MPEEEMSFSQRQGITPPKPIQVNIVDVPLRRDLWNSWYECCIDVQLRSRSDAVLMWDQELSYNLLKRYWKDFLSEPIDQITGAFKSACNKIREEFFRFDWSRVYDFLEFAANVEVPARREKFIDSCNKVLERHNSAWRFSNGKIVRMTDPAEIESIETAIQATTSYPNVQTHLQTAFQKLADRGENPDYRNCIKESISAVEAISKLITDKPDATLDKAVKQLEKDEDKPLHPALGEAFRKLYGFTSDAQGIRHSLGLGEEEATPALARFMFVACSAFINFLVAEYGIRIK